MITNGSQGLQGSHIVSANVNRMVHKSPTNKNSTDQGSQIQSHIYLFMSSCVLFNNTDHAEKVRQFGLLLPTQYYTTQLVLMSMSANPGKILYSP
jgi:hypothetical protein